MASNPLEIQSQEPDDDRTVYRPLESNGRARIEELTSLGIPVIGQCLKGRFVLEELLASGGMGRVFKARDLRKVEARDPRPHVAVKILHEDFRTHPEAWIALQREARRSQQLAHPNIVTVFDFDRDDAMFFMTLELLEGESLAALMQRQGGRPMDLATARPIIGGIAAALSHAHRHGIVHSDVKPGNVFVTGDGQIKMLDFGIARVMRAAVKETDDFDAGAFGALSPAYASCEIIDNAPPDPRDDVYAFACMAYELLGGQHPFRRAMATEARDRKLLPARIPGLRPRQWRTLTAGLSFQRALRLHSVQALLDGLYPPALLTPFARRAFAFLALTVIGATALTAGDWIWERHRERAALSLLAPYGEPTADPTTWLQALPQVRAALLRESAAQNPRVQARAGEIVAGFLLRHGEALEQGDWNKAEAYLTLAERLNIDTRLESGLDRARAELARRRAKTATPDVQSRAPANAPHGQVLEAASRLTRLPVSASQPVYWRNQSLGLALETRLGGALHVFHLSSDGKATLLFPNRAEPDHRIAPGIVKLPKAHHLRIPPDRAAGKSWLLAVLEQGEHPPNLYRDTPGMPRSELAEFTHQDVLDFLNARGQGQNIQAGTAEVQICETAENCDWES